MATCLYFTGYLEVGRSDLVEVSCRLSSRRYLKICPFDGKDTSTPSVSKYRYVFKRKNYCCQTLSSDLRFDIRSTRLLASSLWKVRYMIYLVFEIWSRNRDVPDLPILPRRDITRQRSEEQAIVLIVSLRAYHILTLCFPPPRCRDYKFEAVV